MAAHPLPRTGGCRCDRVRFRLDVEPLVSMACHCTGCQRMTGSAFSLSLAIPVDGFAITQGETTIGGLHAPEIRHRCCPHCLSWVFTDFDMMPGIVNLRTTMLDEPGDLPPFVETMTAEKLPWATTPARHSFERFPPMEAMEALIADYARHRIGAAD